MKTTPLRLSKHLLEYPVQPRVRIRHNTHHRHSYSTVHVYYYNALKTKKLNLSPRPVQFTLNGKNKNKNAPCTDFLALREQLSIPNFPLIFPSLSFFLSLFLFFSFFFSFLSFSFSLLLFFTFYSPLGFISISSHQALQPPTECGFRIA